MLKEGLAGRKKATDLITVLCCANMDGTEKGSLTVIGKSKCSRCFLKDHLKVPVIYRSSANAWMTSVLFEECLENRNRELRLQDCCVCLLVDNCPAHSINVELSHVLKFLPLNKRLRHAADGDRGH